MNTLDELQHSLEKLNQSRQAGDLELIEAYAEEVAHLARVAKLEKNSTKEGISK